MSRLNFDIPNTTFANKDLISNSWLRPYDNISFSLSDQFNALLDKEFFRYLKHNNLIIETLFKEDYTLLNYISANKTELAYNNEVVFSVQIEPDFSMTTRRYYE